MNPPAILAQAPGLEVLNDFASPNAGQELAELVVEALRQEHARALANHFFGPKAEDPFGSGIPSFDRPVQTPAENRIVRILDDSGHLRGLGEPRQTT